MSEAGELQPVTNPAQLERANALLAAIVDAPSDLRPDWLRARNWGVVPVESAKHFEAADAEQIAFAAQRMNSLECAAIATESLENLTRCYAVPLTESGLRDFSWECGSFAYLLVPEDGAWCVLCNYTLYYLVAGPRQFIEDALGCSIEEARRRFERFAEKLREENADSPHAEEANQLHDEILAVAERYEVYNGDS